MEEERWARGRNRSGHQNPSFSSTLLDAIYRSIDESDGGGATHAPTIVPKRPPPLLRPPVDRRAAAAGNERAATRRPSFVPISTSSSSEKSSYGGFSSSSEPDSAATRLRPIRTAGPPIRSAPPPPAAASFDRHEEDEKKKKKKTSSIRGRLRDMKSSRPPAPASPGARLAGFLGSLLSAVSGTPRRPTPTASGCDDSASTASSHSRSCLVKKPSTRERAPPAEGGKRSVRFYPVSVIVDEDLRPCGHKSVYEADRPAETSSRRPSSAAMEARRRVEELLRGMEEEEEEEEETSASSSDLFELENLTVMGMAGGAVHSDELPVYETTHLDTNRSFSQSQRFLQI
ncbi:hypothetical protein BHE74_00000646 [Ensete ventricosum]|nr:hypothetical protein BHE74_00000646 [Ensete ventricosum]